MTSRAFDQAGNDWSHKDNAGFYGVHQAVTCNGRNPEHEVTDIWSQN